VVALVAVWVAEETAAATMVAAWAAKVEGELEEASQAVAATAAA
jgi:hypothetical protein